MKSFMSGFASLILALLCASAAVAQIAPPAPPDLPTSAAAPETPPPAPPAASAAITYQYHLGAGDQVRLNVFGEDDLGGVFTVSGEGNLALPLIGNVSASGKTVAQLEDEIAGQYRQGYLKDPRVTLEVMNFRPFYILGEVNKPGNYPYNNGMTVVNAVALAGGFTYRADQKWVYIKHPNDSKEEKTHLTSDLSVGPGDTVRIAERYF